MGGVSDVLRIITPVVAMVGMGLVIMKFSNLQTWLQCLSFSSLREALSNFLLLSSFLLSLQCQSFFGIHVLLSTFHPIFTSLGGFVRREVINYEFLVPLMSVASVVSKLTYVISNMVSLKLLIYIYLTLSFILLDIHQQNRQFLPSYRNELLDEQSRYLSEIDNAARLQGIVPIQW